jgi:hypothetical protein
VTKGRCNGRKTRSSKRDYSDASMNDSSSLIWKITQEYLNSDERYCVLGAISDDNWIRGVTVPSQFVMWVTWQWNMRHIDMWKRHVKPKRGISIRGI